MVADKFRSIFSKRDRKDKEEDEKLVQELHDILENLEEARAEQLVLTSMAKEKKEGDVPISVEEEKETVDIVKEEKDKEEKPSTIETARKMVSKEGRFHIFNKNAREVKVDKQALNMLYTMSTISVLFEAFKAEFLEYVINKSLTDQKTRDILFKALEKLDKKDLIEIIRIMYRIVDEKLGTGLKVPEVAIPVAQQATATIETTGQSVETASSPKETATSASERKEKKEEEVDLSSLLGEL